jgi:hypothetical protein
MARGDQSLIDPVTEDERGPRLFDFQGICGELVGLALFDRLQVCFLEAV